MIKESICTINESDVIVGCASLNYNIDKLLTKETNWFHVLPTVM